MANVTLPELGVGATPLAGDNFITRQGADTVDKRITLTQLMTALRNLLYGTAGQGISIKEGTNAKQGTATLAAGTAVVANTSVTANSRIFLSIDSGTQTNAGFLRVSTRVVGTSFTITSSNVADTSGVSWEIFEPAP